MLPKKKEHPTEKSGLHPRNKHRERYDFKRLIACSPELKRFVRVNEFGDESVNFFDPEAVKALNKALLKHFYSIGFWDIPPGYLCPPVPGRADYLHHVADLLGNTVQEGQKTRIPKGPKITCLDIGVGANCIYPLIGNKEYGWSFVGSDIDAVSIKAAQHIVERNPSMKGQITCRWQSNAKNIFQGIILPGEKFEVTLCNPPFHSSKAEAQSGSIRKLRNLQQRNITKPTLNFGGQHNELWCAGGEERFIESMVRESKLFSTSCLWFSTLVSKQASLKNTYKALQQASAFEVKTIPMSHGNKASRIVAWSYLSKEEQNTWRQERWR